MFIKLPKSKETRINLTKYLGERFYVVNKACIKDLPNLLSKANSVSGEDLKKMDDKLDAFVEAAKHEVKMLDRVSINVLKDEAARVFVAQDNIYLFHESIVNTVLKGMGNLTFWHANEEDKPLIIKAGENVVAIIMPIKAPETLKDKIKAECKMLVYALTDQNDKWDLAIAQEMKG